MLLYSGKSFNNLQCVTLQYKVSTIKELHSISEQKTFFGVSPTSIFVIFLFVIVTLFVTLKVKVTYKVTTTNTIHM